MAFPAASGSQPNSDAFEDHAQRLRAEQDRRDQRLAATIGGR
jgi:hypothetical protein